MSEISYDYDYEGDSLFSFCTDSYEYDVSVELDNDVILDLDTDGKPVAFEFLNASEVFKINKSYLKKLVKIGIQSDITEENIHVTVNLTIMVNDDSQIFDIDKCYCNSYGISAVETELVTNNV